MASALVYVFLTLDLVLGRNPLSLYVGKYDIGVTTVSSPRTPLFLTNPKGDEEELERLVADCRRPGSNLVQWIRRKVCSPLHHESDNVVYYRGCNIDLINIEISIGSFFSRQLCHCDVPVAPGDTFRSGDDKII